MSWEDVFKDFPKDMVKYGLMGVCESIRTMLFFAKNTDKEKYIKVMEQVLKDVEKDLEEVRKKEVD